MLTFCNSNKDSKLLEYHFDPESVELRFLLLFNAQNEQYIALGVEEGANLEAGANRVKRETEGFYLEPVLFTEVTNSMRITREEVFGPFAAVIRVKDYDEALNVANDTPFGLSAGICTTSLKYAQHFKRNSETGMVMVNLPTAGVDFHVPFGGRKAFSYGPRERGSYAREFFTQVRQTIPLQVEAGITGY